MPSTSTDHLSQSLATMRSERGQLKTRLGKLDRVIAGLEELIGTPPRRKPTLARKTAPARVNGAASAKRIQSSDGSKGGARHDSPVRLAILSILGDGSKEGWSTPELASALIERGVLGKALGGQASEKVRKALNGLKHRGQVSARRTAKGDFAPTKWKLAG